MGAAIIAWPSGLLFVRAARRCGRPARRLVSRLGLVRAGVGAQLRMAAGQRVPAALAAPTQAVRA
jgi:hypothetical protein